MKTNDAFSKTLRKDGYRVTRQRQILLEEIQRAQKHPTAKELYDAVKVRIPNISLGTVYRNLTVLEALGLIRRVPGEGPCRYDSNLEPHYHITCLACGRVADVDADVLAGINPEVLSATGFQSTGYQLEFYGICPECQTKSPQDPSR